MLFFWLRMARIRSRESLRQLRVDGVDGVDGVVESLRHVGVEVSRGGR